MYYVKGLSFQEQTACYYEDRYGLPTIGCPTSSFRSSSATACIRPTDFSVPRRQR